MAETGKRKIYLQSSCSDKCPFVERKCRADCRAAYPNSEVDLLGLGCRLLDSLGYQPESVKGEILALANAVRQNSQLLLSLSSKLGEGKKTSKKLSLRGK